MDVIEHIKIEAENKEYPIVFNINVLEEIQEEYGSLSKWGEITSGDGEPKVKDLKFGLMAMMNEAIEIENDEKGTSRALITSKEAGRIISKAGVNNVVDSLKNITKNSTVVDGEQKNV